jgi:hypothetical protein
MVPSRFWDHLAHEVEREQLALVGSRWRAILRGSLRTRSGFARFLAPVFTGARQSNFKEIS